MPIDLRRWPINDDADSELRFWMNELLASVLLGGAFALAAGLLIAALPKGGDYPGAQFAWEFWPYLVECGFWLGMFVGLLWGTSKRLGMGLAAAQPWQAPRSERESTGRFFGQWSAFAACAGFFLWLTPQVAMAAGLEGAALLAALAPVEATCWIAAGLFAIVAVAHRPRRRAWPASGRKDG